MPQQVGRGEVLGGRFRLTDPLAADPLLHVWLAEDLELRRDVVVKALHPHWRDDETMVERFRFEALAAARLDHENVARTYDVEESDGTLFTISEYVDGPTVEELLANGPLPAAAVAAMGQQTAAGLASAHAQRLVHRAVCPQNLVVTPTGRLCIIDFGSVRDLRADDERLPGPIFVEPGLASYWPPERRAGHAVDERGDVHAVGLVMWEALTGTPQAGAAPTHGAARRLLAGLPGTDALTPRLREILTEATAEEPGQRPTAAHLADRLVEVCGVRPQEQLEALVAGFEGPH